MTTVFTIGYEGASVEDFVVSLTLAGVQRVLDVREIAQSRRRGFSKNGLAETLRASGIEYSHSRQLGDPKPGREAARRGDLDQFKRIFEAHLSLLETREALSAAAEIVQRVPTALLCFERNPQHCHRTLVANHLAEVCSLSVRHLGVVENAAHRYGAVAEAA
ncbi:DUF488 domain-containing protein [Sphingomonas oligophenolica]|uniref:DUF488 domain-containing protein n=1 Tax=Sphingomonas oligophenolica TaxID=301154 RepID=A0ABU9XX01_9SPHN